jgi:xanthine dehydrogenase large subunit
MGQGLFTKVRQVVAHELGLPLDAIRVTASDTSKVPNASPTAASSGSDLNGMAAQDAARKLRTRLAAFAARKFDCEAQVVEFRDGAVHAGQKSLPFAELARSAYFARVPLSATGFYATPKIHYDRKTLSGRPFFYYAYGAAVSEVAIDTLTGEHRLLAVDILHDAGTSLNPAIDRGQIEGGFLQGWGWLAMEELNWNGKGELTTHAPSTYKIPTSRDWPTRVRIDFWPEPNREATIYRSKAVGEPPLMLALPAFHALRDAVASVAGHALAPRLDAPATDERILAAVDDLKHRAAR